MIFEGSVGLYLLMKKRFRGQRLGNVGLNVDEKKRKGGASQGPKGLSGSAGRAAVFFLATEKKEKKEKKL